MANSITIPKNTLPNSINDLNEPFSRNPGFYIDRYNFNASNKSNFLPNDGLLITYIQSNNDYAQQTGFDLAGSIGRRYRYNQTISNWKPISSPIEDKTVTLESGFSAESWGYIAAHKIGRILIVQGSGIFANTATTTLIPFATINNVTLARTTAGIARVGNQVVSIQLHSGTNKLRVSAGCPANTNIDFEIIGICEN